MAKGICVLCEERELSPRSKFDTCPVCRGNIGGWFRRVERQGIAPLVAYRGKLTLRATRMQLVAAKAKDAHIPTAYRKAQNVIPLRKRAQAMRANVNGNGHRARASA